MATPLQSVSTRAGIDSTQTGHRALFSLLTTLKGYVDASVTTAEVATAIERTRVTAARQASSDTYRLVIALPANVPRVEVVSRGNADPPEYVDVVGANGVMFSFRRNGSQWLMQNLAGQTAKLSATAFTNALADSLVTFLRAAK